VLSVRICGAPFFLPINSANPVVLDLASLFYHFPMILLSVVNFLTAPFSRPERPCFLITNDIEISGEKISVKENQGWSIRARKENLPN
jgi:hypothetical protein